MPAIAISMEKDFIVNSFIVSENDALTALYRNS